MRRSWGNFMSVPRTIGARVRPVNAIFKTCLAVIQSGLKLRLRPIDARTILGRGIILAGVAFTAAQIRIRVIKEMAAAGPAMRASVAIIRPAATRFLSWGAPTDRFCWPNLSQRETVTQIRAVIGVERGRAIAVLVTLPALRHVVSSSFQRGEAGGVYLAATEFLGGYLEAFHVGVIWAGPHYPAKRQKLPANNKRRLAVRCTLDTYAILLCM